MIQRYFSANKFIIICGLSFAGKSILGNAISDRFGYPQVDVDKTKFNLYGIDIKDEDLDNQQWSKIYNITDNQIENYLMRDIPVIDASRNFRKSERDHAREIAIEHKADIVVIYVDTPESIVRQRWADNQKKQTRRNVSNNDFEEIISIFEPPATEENPLIFHCGDDIESWFTECTGLIQESKNNSK